MKQKRKTENGRRKMLKGNIFPFSFFLFPSQSRGDILVSVVIFAAVAITVTIGLVNWGAAMLGGIRAAAAREQAFQIAEAGIDYYQWHLAQARTDYQDGTSAPGPYVHQFRDKDGNLLGSYSLTITPPPIGSTKVKIVSKGTLASSTASRTIEAILAVPSLAKYAVVANDNMRFGAGTQTFGPVHSNYGIHFDGTAYNVVTSATSTYIDPDNGINEFGVYTQVSPADPQPPSAVPNRADVFQAGRQFPVPAVDFAGLIANLSVLQTLAQPNYDFTQSQSGGHAALGYHIVLKTNGTFDMFVVTATVSAPGSCGTDPTAQGQSQWGTWSIKTETPYITTGHPTGNYSYPANGVIFVEDHLWVDGQVNNTRLTIAAGLIGNTDPAKNANITINKDLLYSDFAGADVLGLIAQGNINVGLVSNDSLTIDAALLAESGRVGRFYYSTSCKISGVNYYIRSSLSLLGMIATNIRYGFAYTDGTGYGTRTINYDGNLLYGPPPSFPLAASQYQMISWREI